VFSSFYLIALGILRMFRQPQDISFLFSYGLIPPKNVWCGAKESAVRFTERRERKSGAVREDVRREGEIWREDTKMARDAIRAIGLRSDEIAAESGRCVSMSVHAHPLSCGVLII
jgi:hypothetical protein